MTSYALLIVILYGGAGHTLNYSMDHYQLHSMEQCHILQKEITDKFAKHMLGSDLKMCKCVWVE